MNIIVLTPNRVGSTLLQRLLTIYINESKIYNKPVINIQNITNGLKKEKNQLYFNPETWYKQSIDQIIDLLSNTNQYHICKLTLFHLLQRSDTKKDKEKLYNFINDNFYIINASRSNIFEMAISNAISLLPQNKFNNTIDSIKVKKKFNKNIKNQIYINKTIFINGLNQYAEHIKWVNQNFKINKTFNYENDFSNIEKFIYSIPLKRKIKSWDEIFGISFHDWNKCHKLLSEYTKNLHLKILIENEKIFLNNYAIKYLLSKQKIDKLVKDRILSAGGIPIKLHTLIEKKLLIKNFNDLLLWYNEWAYINSFPIIDLTTDIKDVAINELNYWYSNTNNNILEHF